MGIFDLFSSIADNFANRYLEMIQNSAIRRLALKYDDAPRQDCPATTENADTYEPSSETTTQATMLEDSSDPAVTDTTEPAIGGSDKVIVSDPQPEITEEMPLQPYRFRHHTHFNYEVRLQFQLQAIASLAQQIADGETVSQEELIAAGFGLQAAMNFSGKQTVEAGEGNALGDGHGRNASLVKARQARVVAAQSRNFALESFSRESLRIKRSMDLKTGEAYQRAVNRFSLRYRMDTQFSFALLNRFNVQTERFTEADPANVTDYVNTAGGVAEDGTSDMMAAFFDAVDAYLDQAEEALLVKANEFLDLAAEELGYSQDMIAAARGHVTGTIKSFFDQVDDAVAGLESFFLPQQTESTQPDEYIVMPTVSDHYGSPPKDEPANLALA
ncbi:MAG: hypothetical protein JSV52_04190 [Candidatus Zixiibacteriota bacterium]|nr:MAG: hypothetical protein JSV52_04190 [candidate division Zixibacteria bacterium]